MLLSTQTGDSDTPERSEEERIMPEGIVKWFSDKKGYGFIEQEDGSDVFVHYTKVEAIGFRSLKEGDRVVFEIEHTDRGMAASDVRVV